MISSPPHPPAIYTAPNYRPIFLYMLLYVSPNISPPLAPIISFLWNLFIINDVLKLNIYKPSKCKLYFAQHRYRVFLTHLNSIPILRPLGYNTLGSYRGQSQHAKIASIASHWKWLNISSTPLKGRCIAPNSKRRSLCRALSPCTIIYRLW